MWYSQEETGDTGDSPSTFCSIHEPAPCTTRCEYNYMQCSFIQYSSKCGEHSEPHKLIINYTFSDNYKLTLKFHLTIGHTFK